MTHKHNLLALPNEVLLGILNLFPSSELVTYAKTCRQIDSLITRLLCQRLNAATMLSGYTMYMECYHPAAKLTADRLSCTSLGTDGLQEICDRNLEDEQTDDQLERLQGLYTRFRPQRREPELNRPQRHPAGDVPGSRTYVDPTRATAQQEPEEKVMETVTVDANDAWAQLVTVAYLGKREPRKGLLWSIHTIVEGTVRVWRSWLSKHCESRTFSDHTIVDVQYDVSQSDEQEVALQDPTQDSSILWLNTRDNSLGLKLKVKSQRRRMGVAPLMYQSDMEVPVSYVVHFEEILVRSWHLLLKIEEAQEQMVKDSGRAIVFGLYTGIEQS